MDALVEERPYVRARNDAAYIPNADEMCDLLNVIMRGVNAQIFGLMGNTIVGGPFKGMIIPQTTPWDDGNGSTKLLGCYEWELHQAITHSMQRGINSVINLGCSEGFYAVGMARALPSAHVFALDVENASLDVCKEYARQNGVVDRMTFWNGCYTAEELSVAEAAPRRLYIVDVEGYEEFLLDKTKCPDLVDADIIVECHDFMAPAAQSRDFSVVLAERFCDSHNVEMILPQLPPIANYAFPNNCSPIMHVLAVTEKRPMPTRWLACWAKSYTP